MCGQRGTVDLKWALASPMWRSNSLTVRSWRERKSKVQPTEPPRHPRSPLCEGDPIHISFSLPNFTNYRWGMKKSSCTCYNTLLVESEETKNNNKKKQNPERGPWSGKWDRERERELKTVFRMFLTLSYYNFTLKFC